MAEVSTGPVRILLVCEGPDDAWVCQALSDRSVIEHGGDWVEIAGLDSLREWIGYEAGRTYSTWVAVKDLSRKFGVRVAGHLRGEPKKSDAAQTRKAILLAHRIHVQSPVSILSLVRDRDKEAERKEGMAQAVSAHESHPRMLILAAIAEAAIESWILNGFEPRSGEEEALLKRLREEFGFHPCDHAHRLDARGSGQPSRRSGKQV